MQAEGQGDPRDRAHIELMRMIVVLEERVRALEDWACKDKSISGTQLRAWHEEFKASADAAHALIVQVTPAERLEEEPPARPKVYRPDITTANWIRWRNDNFIMHLEAGTRVSHLSEGYGTVRSITMPSAGSGWHFGAYVDFGDKEQTWVAVHQLELVSPEEWERRPR